VFYPIVFSLFNPALVYENEPLPPLRDRQLLKRDNGMWRDFGFGMSCQYFSDFKEIGMFPVLWITWTHQQVCQNDYYLLFSLLRSVAEAAFSTPFLLDLNQSSTTFVCATPCGHYHCIMTKHCADFASPNS